MPRSEWVIEFESGLGMKAAFAYEPNPNRAGLALHGIAMQSAAWNVAVLLFVLGLVGFFVAIPLLSEFAFYLVAFSAALLLLGTWVI